MKARPTTSRAQLYKYTTQLHKYANGFGDTSYACKRQRSNIRDTRQRLRCYTRWVAAEECSRTPFKKMTPIGTLNTLNDLFSRIAAAANPRAILWQDEFGQWQPISSDQIYQRVRALAETFLGWGAKKGDRIALIAENRWEWAITDFATMAIGAVTVPIYPTLTGEQVAAMVADAGCKIAVVSTRQQFDKLNAVRGQTVLDHILIMDPAPTPEGAIAFSDAVSDCDGRGSVHDPMFDALARSVEPKDLATLIYTSGTTGEPKGVMLTHGNFAVNQNYAPVDFSFNSTDACISFLPLSHVRSEEHTSELQSPM